MGNCNDLGTVSTSSPKDYTYYSYPASEVTFINFTSQNECVYFSYPENDVTVQLSSAKDSSFLTSFPSDVIITKSFDVDEDFQTSPQENVTAQKSTEIDYDTLDLRSATKKYKMSGHLVSGGYETWICVGTPNTSNPSGNPIQNVVISDEWED